ncbi:hypothetical protein LINPERHAP1_LOCUS26099 [Linum perenne]
MSGTVCYSNWTRKLQGSC